MWIDTGIFYLSLIIVFFAGMYSNKIAYKNGFSDGSVKTIVKLLTDKIISLDPKTGMPTQYKDMSYLQLPEKSIFNIKK